MLPGLYPGKNSSLNTINYMNEWMNEWMNLFWYLKSQQVTFIMMSNNLIWTELHGYLYWIWIARLCTLNNCVAHVKKLSLFKQYGHEYWIWIARLGTLIKCVTHVNKLGLFCLFQLVAALFNCFCVLFCSWHCLFKHFPIHDLS